MNHHAIGVDTGQHISNIARIAKLPYGIGYARNNNKKNCHLNPPLLLQPVLQMSQTSQIGAHQVTQTTNLKP